MGWRILFVGPSTLDSRSVPSNAVEHRIRVHRNDKTVSSRRDFSGAIENLAGRRYGPGCQEIPRLEEMGGLKKFSIGVAVIQDAKGRFLIARRPKGKHLEGLWEFPGGKCRLKERLAACIKRECREELGVGVTVGARMMKLAYHYPGRSLTLHFHRCKIVSGIPRPLEGQDVKWVAPSRLWKYPHPEANLVLIKRLHLKKVGSPSRGSVHHRS